MCSGTWLCTNTVATSGSSPIANSIAASLSVDSPTTPGRLGDGERVEVDDAVEDVLLVLAGHPVPQRPQVVAEMDVTGGLDAGQHAGHGQRGYPAGASRPPVVLRA